MPISRTQLPEDASVLQQMVLDLIAQLDAEQSKRFKTEQLLRQLLAARMGRKSEQLSREQLALVGEELKAQRVNPLKRRAWTTITTTFRHPREAPPQRSRMAAGRCRNS